MSRAQKFLSYRDNAWFGKYYKKLAANDIAFALDFIATNDHLDKNDFEMAVNRMGLDKPDLRAKYGKKWGIIQELIANANKTDN